MSAPTRTVARLNPANLLRNYAVLGVLVVLVLAVTAVQPHFLDYRNVTNMLSQWAPAGLMAIGMTFVIIAGGFDLSVAAIYALSAVTAAGLGRTEPVIVAFGAALTLAALLGLVNGVIVTIARVNPFIATLGSSFAIAGVTLVVTHNQAYVVSFPPFSAFGTGRWHGMPYSGMLLLAGLVLGGVALGATTFGQKVYAVGGNAEASRLVGIRTRTVTTGTYLLSGVCAGTAGVVSASQLSSAQAGLGADIVFDVITVVVVGGTSLAGGSGAMWRTAVGLGILAALQNGFNLLNVDPHYQDIVKGVIIIGALSLDVLSQKLGSRQVTAPASPASDVPHTGPESVVGAPKIGTAS